jgi:rRNA-processing protein FCF1
MSLPSGIVLDANALMMPFQFRLNLDREIMRLFGEASVYVPSSVLGELSGLADKNAKAALALARKYSIVETDMSGDDGVIDVAERRSAAVLTNDKELIRRLGRKHIEVVRLRGKAHLVRDER